MMSTRPSRRSRQVAGSKKREETSGSLLRFVLVVAILAWAFRCLVGAPFSIPSASMLPALYIGDYVGVAKWPYGYSRYSFIFGIPTFKGRIAAHLPKRGDVVVFRHPTEDSDLIKRVIGLPGDTVAVRDGVVILNGKPVPRRARPAAEIPISANSPCRAVPPALPAVRSDQGHPVCLYRAFVERLPGGPGYTVLDQVDGGPADNFGPVRVPMGHIFLMGDNRDNSSDSRFAQSDGGIGMVPMENLIGRAGFTFWSTDGSASYWKPWTWFSALRTDRIGNGYTKDSE